MEMKWSRRSASLEASSRRTIVYAYDICASYRRDTTDQILKLKEKTFIQEAARWMSFATAAYGWAGFIAQGGLVQKLLSKQEVHYDKAMWVAKKQNLCQIKSCFKDQLMI